MVTNSEVIATEYDLESKNNSRFLHFGRLGRPAVGMTRSCGCTPLVLATFALLIEKRLQDHGGGNLVDDAAVCLTCVARFIQQVVRLVRREALVPKVNRQSGEFAEMGGEGLNLGGLRADFARELERIAHHDSGNLVAAAQAGQGAKVFARIAAARESQDGLRRQAELVGDRDADAFGTDIEREVARGAGLVRQWLIRHVNSRVSA